MLLSLGRKGFEFHGNTSVVILGEAARRLTCLAGYESGCLLAGEIGRCVCYTIRCFSFGVRDWPMQGHCSTVIEPAVEETKAFLNAVASSLAGV